ncbi:MAG: hypothetical protein U9O94_00300 [Nanoarchaeota archaeon]|nr:hypothetical protein [Nanoarchaeota archaeon]
MTNIKYASLPINFLLIIIYSATISSAQIDIDEDRINQVIRIDSMLPPTIEIDTISSPTDIEANVTIEKTSQNRITNNITVSSDKTKDELHNSIISPSDEAKNELSNSINVSSNQTKIIQDIDIVKSEDSNIISKELRTDYIPPKPINAELKEKDAKPIPNDGDTKVIESTVSGEIHNIKPLTKEEIDDHNNLFNIAREKIISFFKRIFK